MNPLLCVRNVNGILTNLEKNITTGLKRKIKPAKAVEVHCIRISDIAHSAENRFKLRKTSEVLETSEVFRSQNTE